jgi:FtsH-binding integral membrane protein
MFIGHFAVGLGAKKVAPQVKLGTLFFAAQFLDLLWPIFLILGIEHARINPGDTAFTPFDFYDYPYSHSLLASIVWSVLIGGIFYYLKKNLRNSIIVGCAVFSHWLLDFFSHKPDLPIAPGIHTVLGLGLWNSIIGTLFIEGFLFIGAIYLYIKTTKSIDRIGNFAFWGLIALLLISYIANMTSPPPPNMTAVAYAGFTQWLFIAWAYWIDRHRHNRILH